MRFLNDVIILAVHANPDGMDLVSDWYMRETRSDEAVDRRHAAALPEVHRARQQPRLLHVEPQPETQNMNRVLYREWFPQIMYNHHQTGPAGTVMFAPPFRDPFNYNFDPARRRSASTSSAPRCATGSPPKGKPGVTSRKGAQLLDVVERRPAHDRATSTT